MTRRKKSIKLVTLSILGIILLMIPLTMLTVKQELSQLDAESEYQVSQVEQNVMVAVNFVDYIQTMSVEYFSQDYHETNPLYDDLEYIEEKDMFAISQTALENGTFNSTLSGVGQIPVSQAAIEELGFIFSLDKLFIDYYENNDNVIWAYYISESGIVSSYPYDEEFMYSSESVEILMDEEYYINALPENNPERTPSWTGVYTDQWGQGELITLSAPIYDGDEFLGVIAVDRSIDDLREIFQADYDTYLYDIAYDELIVSNTDIDPYADTENHSTVSTDELESILEQATIEDHNVEYIDGNFIFTQPIENTDWAYASVIPASDLIFHSVVRILPVSIILLIIVFGFFFNSERKERQIIIERNKEIRLTQEVTIETLSALTEARDSETGYHISRTKLYVHLLTDALAKTDKHREYLTPEKMRDIYVSAPLHDIGKVGIRDHILLKPGKLTNEEFETMKLHTQIGADALLLASRKLGSISFLDCAVDMSLCHHERWDGKGYPNGLKGEEIPLAARIMSVSDVYDALRSDRVYKQAFSHEKSLEILVSESGTAFDPDVVEAFLKNAEKFKMISEDYLD